MNDFTANTAENSKSGHHPVYVLLLGVSIIAFIITVAMLVTGRISYAGPFLVTMFVALALYVRISPFWSVASFSLWMLASVTAPMYYPGFFTSWGPMPLQPAIIPLIRFVMFCMGTTLSISDFKRVLKMPQAVLVGIMLQYTIMPFVAKGIAMSFISNSEVAAGIVLTGSSPGGVASNVISFLAGANVALSVTMTAISTLVAPFMTPFMTKWLAGAYVPIDFMAMMWSIVKMVVIPVGGGLIFNKVLHRIGSMHHSLLAVSRFIIFILPAISMFAICAACAIMTAGARDKLLIGPIVVSIVLSVIAHNALGLTLGYWGARLFGFGERECRTIAIEVGLQNSGMAAGLAVSVLKSQLAAVPGVVYSSWHNITGAMLASVWKRRVPGMETAPEE